MLPCGAEALAADAQILVRRVFPAAEIAGTDADDESARRETTLQREIAVKNASLGIFDPSLGIFDPTRSRRNPDLLGWFSAKTPLGVKE